MIRGEEDEPLVHHAGVFLQGLTRTLYSSPHVGNTLTAKGRLQKKKKISEKWLGIGVPPHFSPKFFFSKMTQNGLKWILNTTCKNVTF